MKEMGTSEQLKEIFYGALAGAAYGYEAIPKEWIDRLQGEEVIEGRLF